MEELKNITNCRYNSNGELFFNAEGKEFKISQKDALELAYTLFDSLGHNYDELDNIYEELS